MQGPTSNTGVNKSQQAAAGRDRNKNSPSYSSLGRAAEKLIIKRISRVKVMIAQGTSGLQGHMLHLESSTLQRLEL